MSTMIPAWINDGVPFTPIGGPPAQAIAALLSHFARKLTPDELERHRGLTAGTTAHALMTLFQAFHAVVVGTVRGGRRRLACSGRRSGNTGRTAAVFAGR